MCIFCVPQNAGITFKVRSSYKEKFKPYMCPFGVAQIAGIAFRVGLFQNDFACAYCV